MMLGSLMRKVEERVEKECTEEILRIAAEWDKLSPKEKTEQSLADFFSARLMQLDEKRKSRRRDRESRLNEPNLFRVLFVPFGFVPYFNWDGCSPGRG